MRRTVALAWLAGLLIVTPALAQTAIELKKELLPKIKKAQADGKDLGPAQEFYNEGDKLLKDGMQDEAAAAFKKARDAMPKN
jgi:outer membrane protein assembly factor BamD (BamD/ComL family)